MAMYHCSPRLLASVWALGAFLLPGVTHGSGEAVLRVEPVFGSQPKEQHFLAILADWSKETEGKVSGTPLFYNTKNRNGCDKQPACSRCAILVKQGNCTFAQKARRAQAAGASLLVVIHQEGPPTGMAMGEKRTHMFAPRDPTIVTVMISFNAGRELLLKLERGDQLKATTWRSERIYGDIISEVLVGVLAVVLIVFGAWHSVEDLRHPERKERFNEECLAVEEKSGIHFVMFGSIMLTVLFFFMKYLIYVLLFLFATGAVGTTTTFLEPVISGWFPHLQRKKACNLPSWLASVLGVPEDHTWAEAISEFMGGILAVLFLLYRNNDSFGWLLQDAIAVMFLLTIQRTLRLPNLKVGTLLLVCTFFFDIFWVFISPLIFQKSVMIEVATGGGTGQSVPMVLKIPAMSSAVPGQFKILGLGDIAIPGLLISLLLRHDIVSHSKPGDGYFTAGCIGYALGLIATFISLYLMKHGQPALLFLVPGTLLPTFWIARRKGEFQRLWSADYGPELGDSYERLSDGEKEA